MSLNCAKLGRGRSIQNGGTRKFVTPWDISGLGVLGHFELKS